MKEVFVVLRKQWKETDEEPDSIIGDKSYPTGVFATHGKAVKYIKARLEQYPKDYVYSEGDNRMFYEDDGHEIDAYEIHKIPFDESV